jgi:hypothetical protein
MGLSNVGWQLSLGSAFAIVQAQADADFRNVQYVTVQSIISDEQDMPVMFTSSFDSLS